QPLRRLHRPPQLARLPAGCGSPGLAQLTGHRRRGTERGTRLLLGRGEHTLERLLLRHRLASPSLAPSPTRTGPHDAVPWQACPITKSDQDDAPMIPYGEPYCPDAPVSPEPCRRTSMLCHANRTDEPRAVLREAGRT